MLLLICRATAQNFMHVRRFPVKSLQRCYSLNPILKLDEYSQCNSPEMLESMKRRNITLDLSNLKALTQRYQDLNEKKAKIEIARGKISEEIIQLNEVDCEERKSSLNSTAKILRKDYKMLKSIIEQIEAQLFSFSLKLPNLIDNKTLDNEVELFSSPFEQKESDSHLNIGHQLDILEFLSPMQYFLKKGGGLLEISILNYFTSRLIQNKFTPFSNPDSCRSIIKELSCENIISLGKLTDSDFLYLHGAASFIPFLSYFYRSVISGELPIRLVSQGRKYSPKSKNEGLYTVHQKSAVQIFIIGCNETINLEFENLINYITEIYQSLEVPFRISYCSASNLSPSESLRADIEVYSGHYKKFKSVGHVSLYNDYFSKRSKMYYSKGNTTYYTHLISGTIVEIPPLIASVIEHTQNCELPICITRC
ncbi:serine--tRNA synthetase-like protein Slimp [Cimex lectularius]|uniref:Aminoacyl-tRNA synthetase class II (G/ P/ S/T) domain-containing protein n=1 Tax=Cimex lectularius TaxID=79782 RepID=A0A8I6RZ38_CIMLE|nr:serine--tRNA synthetase-like protein Slimp [Cimex lectularius]